jgi:hypothetical protein
MRRKYRRTLQVNVADSVHGLLDEVGIMAKDTQCLLLGFSVKYADTEKLRE